MTTLFVPGIHCEGCVKRIKTALDEAGIAHTVSLADKTVIVDDAAVNTAVSELDDLGFDAEVK